MEGASLRRISFFIYILIFTCLITIPLFLLYTARQTKPPLHFHSRQVMGWEANKSRSVAEYLPPMEDLTLISVRGICRPIVVVVCSKIQNYDQRLAVRNTWAHENIQKAHNVSVIFITGVLPDGSLPAQVHLESALYEDVIVENFVDTYNNLTLKSILMLKWVEENCPGSEFLMKTDDDSYIDLNNLAKFLHQVPKEQLSVFLIGRLMCNLSPVSDPNNKWYTPPYLYPFKTYPPYLAGAGYIMSMQVARRLYLSSFTIEILHMEDIFITGLCAMAAGIPPKSHPAFQESVAPSCKSDSQLIIRHHEVRTRQMYRIQEKLEKCSRDGDLHSWSFFLYRLFLGQPPAPKFRSITFENFYQC